MVKAAGDAWDVSAAARVSDMERTFTGTREQACDQLEALARERGLEIRIDAFTDEIRADYRSGKRWRLWLNLQAA